MAGYSGMTALVTGGTGSFGKTITTHLLDSEIDHIRVFSRDEAKQHFMREDFGHDPRLSFHIGDVRDFGSIDVASRGVDLVFHAAALKQVPSCEFFPIQAVYTNIIGSQNVLDAAIKNDVEAVVCLSTDKAVLPLNAMGMSKALMEKVAVSYARGAERTRICTVRYGNVLYSRGSVLPLFVDRIAAGEALTITNPMMTRFLMPLSSAVDLVDFAFKHGANGDNFIRKAPAAQIGDLATAVLELFDSDVGLVNIGTRHGEKLFETLATAEELARAEDLGDYWRIPMDHRDLNYASFFDGAADTDLADADDFHSHNAKRLSVDEVKDLLVSLPEMQLALEQGQGMLR